MRARVWIGWMLALAWTAGGAPPLRLEGDGPFRAQDLQAALERSLEYQLDRSSTQPEKLAALTARLLAAGYRHMGFPAARVAVTGAASGLTVRVTAGPRYRRGDLRVEGLKEVPESALRYALLPPPSDLAASSNAASIVRLWGACEWAPFDDGGLQHIRAAVTNAFTDAGRFFPRFRADLATNAAGAADLVIAVESEGPALTVGETHIDGEKINPPEDILGFLGLKPEARLTQELVRDVERRLRRSGRFIGVSAHPDRSDAAGKAPLHIQVLEAPYLPRLHEPLPPAAETFLRLADWVEALQTNGEELVLSGELTIPDTGHTLALEAVMAPARGAAFSVRDARAHDLRFAAALSAAGSRTVLFPAQRVLWSSPGGSNQLVLSLALTAHPPSEEGKWKGLNVGVSFSTATGSAFRLDLTADPAVLAALACEAPSGSVRVADGLCTYTATNVTLSVETDTGRLRELRAKSDKPPLTATLRAARGEFDRFAAALARETTGWTNRYDADHPAASFLDCALPELANISQLSTTLVARLPRDQWTRCASAYAKVSRAVASAPWDDWFDTQAETNAFVIPFSASALPPGFEKSFMGLVAMKLLAAQPPPAPPGTWLDSYLHLQAWRLGNRMDLIKAETDRLRGRRDAGPLGPLALAYFLTPLSPAQARDFVRRAQMGLKADALARELLPLAGGDSMAGAVFAAALDGLSSWTPEEADAVLRLLPDAPRAAWGDVLRILRENRAAAARDRVAKVMAGRPGPVLDLVGDAIVRRGDAINLAALGVPPRAGPLPTGALELSWHFNGGLPMLFAKDEAAAARLVSDATNIAGRAFDVRGLIVPDVTDSGGTGLYIPVGRTAAALHLLLGALIRERTEGATAARFVIHYADNESASVSALVGRDVDVLVGPAQGPGPKPAWAGPARHPDPDYRTRLYPLDWKNPRPDAVIESLEIRRPNASVTPLIIAISADP